MGFGDFITKEAIEANSKNLDSLSFNEEKEVGGGSSGSSNFMGEGVHDDCTIIEVEDRGVSTKDPNFHQIFII